MAVVRKRQTVDNPRRDTALVEADLRARLDGVGLLNVPVNIQAIAEFLGLEVVEESMEDDLSGYLEERSGSWVVGINAFHHINRKRFTIAHEIGHFLLHSARQVSFHDQTFARRNDSHNPMEQEADRFAAQLLMPERDVRSLIASGVTTLSGLAEHFGVSALAMKYRVQNLGYRVNQ